MAAYVCGQPPERIAKWSGELLQLPIEEKAKWRGSARHSSGEVLPIRWNEGLGIFEIEVSKTLLEGLECHNAKALPSLPNLIIPPDRWAPIRTNGPLSDTIMEHYYGPSFCGGYSTAMTAASAQNVKAYNEKLVKDDALKKALQETAKTDSQQGMFTDEEIEALKKALQETAKKTASQQEEDGPSCRGCSKGCKGYTNQEQAKPDFKKMDKAFAKQDFEKMKKACAQYRSEGCQTS
jgi:hypothetical protein